MEDQTEEVKANLNKLLVALNKVRVAYNKPMMITSGLRSIAEQQRTNPVATKSRHITGEAADVSDPNKAIQVWCLANEQVLIDAGLYMEDFDHTPTWVHFQCVPPKSGHRYFIP